MVLQIPLSLLAKRPYVVSPVYHFVKGLYKVQNDFGYVLSVFEQGGMWWMWMWMWMGSRVGTVFSREVGMVDAGEYYFGSSLDRIVRVHPSLGSDTIPMSEGRGRGEGGSYL
jgi:hypothetical protein